MKNRYETVFIMTPVLSEQQTKETVKKFKDYIADKKGKVVFEQDWGLRKLAYPIEKKTTAFYYLLEFEMEGEWIEKLGVEFRRDERIMRHLTVRMDKHHIAFAESRRDRKINSNADQEEMLVKH